MRFAVRLGKDHRVRVAVFAPLLQNLSCQLAELVFVFEIQTQNRHRVLHDTAGNVFKTGHLEREFRFRFLHRERVIPALEVFMNKNAAADDGQVCVRAEEIVWELLDK